MNTKFFHALATSRRKVNKINSLYNVDEILVVDQVGMCNITRSYFGIYLHIVVGFISLF